jgi:multidrug efflux pump subunit AcrA (membrane-fusion protein)
VDQVELRAQVGGTLTYIGFKDGYVVRKGALLFTIDPTPYQIKFDEGTAQISTARARLELAKTELARAQTLQKTDAGTLEKVEQRAAEQRSAQAALDEAEAQVRDAKFDLDRTHVYAPFTGRMGTRLRDQPESPLADRKGLWVAEADRQTAAGQVARGEESGLAVSLPLRRAQPDPTSQTRSSTTRKAQGAVCPNYGDGHRGWHPRCSQTPMNTDRTTDSNGFQPSYNANPL